VHQYNGVEVQSLELLMQTTVTVRRAIRRQQIDLHSIFDLRGMALIMEHAV
jgi:hypothetical protein